MTLTYRGVAYQTFNLTINTEKTELKATYRGQSYQVNAPVNLGLKPAQNLIYRGVKYNKSTVSNSAPTIPDLQPVLN